MSTDEVIACQDCSMHLVGYKLFNSVDEYIKHLRLEHNIGPMKLRKMEKQLRKEMGESTVETLDNKEELHEKLAEME